MGPWCSSLCFHSGLGLCQRTPGSYEAEFFAFYPDLIENFNCSHHIEFYCFASLKPMNTKDFSTHLITLCFFINLFRLVFNSLIESIAIYQLLLIISIISTT